MTLPVSGPISLSQVNVEFSRSSTSTISLNDSDVRSAFGVPSGAIRMSDGYGKSRPPVSVSNSFTTPNGLYAPGDVFSFSRGTGITSFPIRNGISFQIYLYGAGGGAIASGTGTGGNSNGGIIGVNINLSSYANQTLYLVRGGGGANSTSSIDGNCGVLYVGGYNGGGNGAGTRGPGGGGRTDLRTISGTVTSELLVAGGGGGGSGTLGSTTTRYQGDAGLYGAVGKYCADNGGGGGGYYGGAASASDDGSNAGSGTNYYNTSITTSVLQNTLISGTAGGNSGDGYFTITVISTS